MFTQYRNNLINFYGLKTMIGILASRIKGLAQLGNLLPALIVIPSLTLVACYDSTTGETEIGPSITFDLPVFSQTGSHAVQVFTEMHYQPSYRSQEIPRIHPPSDSIPTTGKEMTRSSIEEYQVLAIPSDAINTYDLSTVESIYQTNCQVCHGAKLDGNGAIVEFMDRGPMPVDLKSDSARQASDGELFGFISGGGRQGLSALLRNKPSTSPMPRFGSLLSEQERWWLVQYVRNTR